MGQETIHLTLEMALPLQEARNNVLRSGDRSSHGPVLTRHDYAALRQTASLVARAAAFCLRSFKPYQQEMLWWVPLDKEGHLLMRKVEPGDTVAVKEGGSVALIKTDEARFVPRLTHAGHLPLVSKLGELAPLKGFPLSSTVRLGTHHKVADLLQSYAQRKLDPATADKTSYPRVEGDFPIVWRDGFSFYEHADTGKLYLYVPLFPRGGREESLPTNYNAMRGPRLRVLGKEEIAKLRATGGLLLPLQFDKWGEATFVRGRSTPPTWKATHRKVDKRWLAEILVRDKDFHPKQVEILVRGERVFVNVACDVPVKPTIASETFMGVSFGLEHLITIVVINKTGEVVYQHQLSSARYEHLYSARLKRLRRRGGAFAKELETLHYRELSRVVSKAVELKSVVALEIVGTIVKGGYSPGMNRRLSYWPFGRLADIAGYKLELEGIPTPYTVYSKPVKTLCSNCGEENLMLQKAITFCPSCTQYHNTGVNTALNLARRSAQLHREGKVAR